MSTGTMCKVNCNRDRSKHEESKIWLLGDLDAAAGKDRAIHDDRLVLATLAAGMHPKRALELQEQRFELAKLPPHVLGLQPHRGDLDHDGMNAARHNRAQEHALVKPPQVTERSEPDPGAHRFQPHTLVVAENGPARNGLNRKVKKR